MAGRGSRLMLTMFTHKHCQLCVNAKEALSEVHKQVPFDLKEIDIKKPGNEEWFEEYKFDVPVIHVNDEFLLWHRVNIADTISKLKAITEAERKEK